MSSVDKKPLYSLRALGAEDPPESVVVGGVTWRRTEIIKHDFFAATAFYESGGVAGEPSPGGVPPPSPSGGGFCRGRDKAVLKIGRAIPYWGLPMTWLGRRLRNREVRIYQRLGDLPNVPEMLGVVGETGFLHAFVEGRPLEKGKPVPDGFFAELEALLREVHKRGIAYVDTNKPQNILLGDDGRPRLIDFQISFDRNKWPTKWLVRRMQREDLYHIRKHRRRLRPDELTPEEIAESLRVSGWVKLHRVLTWPYFRVRRWIFRRLKRDGRLLPSGSD